MYIPKWWGNARCLTFLILKAGTSPDVFSIMSCKFSCSEDVAQHGREHKLGHMLFLSAWHHMRIRIAFESCSCFGTKNVLAGEIPVRASNLRESSTITHEGSGTPQKLRGKNNFQLLFLSACDAIGLMVNFARVCSVAAP